MIFTAVSHQKEKMISLQPFRDAMGLEEMRISAPTGEIGLTFPERLPTIKQITETLVNEALTRAKGNQAVAAGLLGITPQALSKRLSRTRKSL
jgi:transcriptional regulator with AAA-type ATPase domain